MLSRVRGRIDNTDVIAVHNGGPVVRVVKLKKKIAKPTIVSEPTSLG